MRAAPIPFLVAALLAISCRETEGFALGPRKHTARPGRHRVRMADANAM